MKWLLLLPQLPAGNSTARVGLWRQLRASGAANAIQGAWVLPADDKRRLRFEELATSTHQAGGTAVLFESEVVHGLSDEDLILGFRADRAREYDEFATKVADFFAEVDKETNLGKFDFAELEEIEDDLHRLTRWLNKIRERDFFPDERLTDATALLGQCEEAFQRFAGQVYHSQAAEAPSLPESADDLTRGGARSPRG